MLGNNSSRGEVHKDTYNNWGAHGFEVKELEESGGAKCAEANLGNL